MRTRSYVCWSLVASLAACGGPAEQDAAAGGGQEAAVSPALQQSLRAAAERFERSFDEMDIDVQLELAHPSVIAQVGGPSNYRRVLQRAKQSLTAVQPPKGRITDIGEIVVKGDGAFAFVGFEIEMTSYDGVRGVKESFFVVESPKDGSAWRFLDGTNMHGSLAELRKSIPDWPEELPPRQAKPFRKL